MRKFGTIIDNLKQGLQPPTSHSNPYLAESLALSDQLFTQEELKESFHRLFPIENPLVIEIGCYMGKTVVELSLANPNINFLGLDITYKRVVKSARKLKNNDLQNGKIAICDGRYFLEHIACDNTFAGICVFFPDPWPREKQKKNRLLNKEFVALMLKKLSPNGFFWFKTDSQRYFLETQELLLQAGFVADDESLNQPQNIAGGPYETPFQKLFSAQNVPFYHRVYLKK